MKGKKKEKNRQKTKQCQKRKVRERERTIKCKWKKVVEKAMVYQERENETSKR